MKHDGPIKVLLVDDSALVRSVLQQALSRMEGINVVGDAEDPYEAREFIIDYRPDVIILDIEMPRMDGLTFLKKLQAHYPVPVIMCSGIAPANSRTALEARATDVVTKPATGGSKALARLAEDLAEKIRAAAIAVQTRPSIPVSLTAPPPLFEQWGLTRAATWLRSGLRPAAWRRSRPYWPRFPLTFRPLPSSNTCPKRSPSPSPSAWSGSAP